MKVVLLAKGLSTGLAEETSIRPKQNRTLAAQGEKYGKRINTEFISTATGLPYTQQPCMLL